MVATGNDETAMQKEPDAQRIHAAAERMRQSAEARTAASGTGADVAAFEPAAQIVRQPEHEQAAAMREEAGRANEGAQAPAQAQAQAQVPSPAPTPVPPAPVITEADFARELDREMHASVPPEMPLAQPGAPRMPRVDELPQIGREQVARASSAQDGDASPVGGLFRRIASGFSGHGEGAASATAAPQPAARPAPPATPQQPVHTPQAMPQTAAEQPAPRAPLHEDDVSYAPTRAPSLDAHGRQTARPVSEEDQLDIPAFLRRQAN